MEELKAQINHLLVLFTSDRVRYFRSNFSFPNFVLHSEVTIKECNKNLTIKRINTLLSNLQGKLTTILNETRNEKPTRERRQRV